MTEAEAVAALATKNTLTPQILTGADGQEYLVTPDGMEHEKVGDPNMVSKAKPKFIRQSVTLQATESLGVYVNRYKGPTTLLFADVTQNAIAALIDYHGVVDDAEHVAHRATMVLPFSEEWNIWKGASGQLKPQLEFARFIEENGGDVVAPSGGEILDAMRDLQANRKVNFIKAVRTSSDNENFEYTDETEMKTRGGIEVPTKFKLNIPVYFGEPATEVYAFLRWKLDDGKLTLGIVLHRAEHVRQAVFKQIVLAVGEATACPVVFGKAS